MKKLLMTEEFFDRRLTVSHKSGIASATEAAAKRLLAAAGELFQQGRDDEARLLRDNAKELSVQAEKDWAEARAVGKELSDYEKLYPIQEVEE